MKKNEKTKVQSKKDEIKKRFRSLSDEARDKTIGSLKYEIPKNKSREE